MRFYSLQQSGFVGLILTSCLSIVFQVGNALVTSNFNCCSLGQQRSTLSFTPTYIAKQRSKHTSTKSTSLYVSTVETSSDNIDKSRKPNTIRRDKNKQKSKKLRNIFLRRKTQQLLRLTSVDTSDPYNVEFVNREEMGHGKLRVNKKTFSWLIDAWRIKPGGAIHAESLLKRLEEMDERNARASGFGLEPTTSFTPDVRIFTKVIHALARSGQANAGEKAEGILTRMEHLADTGKNPSAKPNTLTYTAVIEAYANSEQQNGDSARKADRIYQKMEALHQAGHSDVHPTARSLHSLILAWNRSGETEAAYNAHEILQHMQHLALVEGFTECKPTAASYNSVIDAYAKSGEPNAVAIAESILHEMEDLHKNTSDASIKPNTKTYNSLLNAYAKSGDSDAPHKAEALLTKMEDMFEHGNVDVSPDVTSFSTVINAWARSHNYGKAEHALKIFNQMSELYNQGKNTKAQPNTIIYNSVMNACAFTVGNELEQVKALNIAYNMFTGLESSPYGSPDAITYGTYLKVCANQMPDGDLRRSIIEATLKKCIRDGQVGELVLQQLKVVAPADLYTDLTGRLLEDPISIYDIPLTWKCNVIEKKRRGGKNTR